MNPSALREAAANPTAMNPTAVNPTAIGRTPARLSLDRLLGQVSAPRSEESHAAWESPAASAIDREKWFVCPTCTPFYYSEIYSELPEPVARRYNQLSAFALNELVRFLETEIAPALLPALANCSEFPSELRESFRYFAAEEEEHAEAWRELNRAAAPELYANTDAVFVRPPAVARAALRQMAIRPRRFPWVVWLVLSMEELSLAVARRSHQSGVPIEEHFLGAYHAHQREEIRHVQLDWYAIEALRANAGPLVRWGNARFLQWILAEFFLAPVRAGRRVLERLAFEMPEFAPRLSESVRALRVLANDPRYVEALYSRNSHPITFALFDRYPEFHRFRELFAAYEAPADWRPSHVG